MLITSREDQGKGIVVLKLASIGGVALPAFTAGAHIDMRINDWVRQYSLSNAPKQFDHYRIGVFNDPKSRGGSAAVFNEFHTGKKIQISRPRNHFAIQSHAGSAILVAGGIGITPIISMAYELREQNRDFEIHYCLNQVSDGAFVEELKNEFPQQLHIYCTDDKEFAPIATFNGRCDQPHLYVCGPAGFMDWVIAAAKQEGLPDAHLHLERFDAEFELEGKAFAVYCAKSQLEVKVASDQTIVGALAIAGIKVDVSCEQGLCGTCITDVLEGEPDHRDQFLTAEEKRDNDQMALCCSRAKSARLVIDI